MKVDWHVINKNRKECVIIRWTGKEILSRIPHTQDCHPNLYELHYALFTCRADIPTSLTYLTFSFPSLAWLHWASASPYPKTPWVDQGWSPKARPPWWLCEDKLHSPLDPITFPNNRRKHHLPNSKIVTKQERTVVWMKSSTIPKSIQSCNM